MMYSTILLVVFFVHHVLASTFCIRISWKHGCSLSLNYLIFKRFLTRWQRSNILTLIPLMEVVARHWDALNSIKLFVWRTVSYSKPFLVLKSSRIDILQLLLHAASLNHINFTYVIRIIAFKSAVLNMGIVCVVAIGALHLRTMYQTLFASVTIQDLIIVISWMIFTYVRVMNLWQF